MNYREELIEYKYELGKQLFEALKESSRETDDLIDYVSEILTHEINVNYQDTESGYTSLMLAIEHNLPNVFNLIIQHEPNIEISNNSGINALHIAASSRNPHYLVSLCEHNANVDAPDNLGNRPINYAIKARRVSNIIELQDRLCTLNFLNILGRSIYDDAAATADEDVIACVFNYDKKQKRGLVKRLIATISEKVLNKD